MSGGYLYDGLPWFKCGSKSSGYRAFFSAAGFWKRILCDKVFRVVDMYHSGIWDRERALKEMKVYPDYDQIAFISQKAINQLLNYESKAEWFKGTC